MLDLDARWIFSSQAFWVIFQSELKRAPHFSYTSRCVISMHTRGSIWKLFLLHIWFVVRSILHSYVPFAIYSVSTVHTRRNSSRVDFGSHAVSAWRWTPIKVVGLARDGRKKNNHLIRVRIKLEKIILRSVYLSLGFAHPCSHSSDIIPLTTPRTRIQTTNKPMPRHKTSILHSGELILCATAN